MSAEYTARVNRVMDHVEQHLHRPLPLRELARVACFSPHHFHRIFSAMTGETLNGFVQRLRLERAAAQLIRNQEKSVTEVALDCGFSSSAVFARSFRGNFGMSASAWRAGGHARRKICKAERNPGQRLDKPRKATRVSAGHLDPRTHHLHWRIEMHDDKGRSSLVANVEIRELPPVHVAYLRHVGPYAGDEALFERLWGQMMKWAAPRGLFRPPETRMMTVYHDDPEITEQDRLRLSVCINVPPGTEVGGEIGEMTVAGGTYGVARFELQPQQYPEAWAALYGGWLPESGYQPDDRPAFEECLAGPDQTPDGRHVVEINVPVKPL